MQQERRRRELPPELPSSYGVCLSSYALKGVHLIAGHHSNSEEYVTVDVFWRTRGLQSEDPGGQDRFASALVQSVEGNHHYEGLQGSFEDRWKFDLREAHFREGVR